MLLAIQKPISQCYSNSLLLNLFEFWAGTRLFSVMLATFIIDATSFHGFWAWSLQKRCHLGCQNMPHWRNFDRALYHRCVRLLANSSVNKHVLCLWEVVFRSSSSKGDTGGRGCFILVSGGDFYRTQTKVDILLFLFSSTRKTFGSCSPINSRASSSYVINYYRWNSANKWGVGCCELYVGSVWTW